MELARRRILWTGIIISLAGFADASYLTYSHLVRNSIICSILEGCDRVLTSEYAEIYGIPVAFLGMVFYATMIALFSQIYFMAGMSTRAQKVIFPVSLCAVLVSIYFTYLQVSVINAYCQYCLLSAFFTLLLSGISFRISRQ